jgi:hypothetical protein
MDWLLPSLPLPMLFSSYFHLSYFYYHKIMKEKMRRLANQKPKDKQEPSVLSSHYCVSVSLQGVHYL